MKKSVAIATIILNCIHDLRICDILTVEATSPSANKLPYSFSSFPIEGHPRDMHKRRLQPRHKPMTREELTTLYFGDFNQGEESLEKKHENGDYEVEAEERNIRRKMLQTASRNVRYTFEDDNIDNRGSRNKMWKEIKRMQEDTHERESYNESWKIPRTQQWGPRFITPSLFQPLRIHFDTSELDAWSLSSSVSTSNRITYLKTKVLPGMAQLWSAALKVIPPNSPLQIDWTWCPFGDQSTSIAFNSTGIADTDVIVFVTANGDSCTDGGSVLASAKSCFWDQYERPLAGYIDFCLDTIELGELSHDTLFGDIHDTMSTNQVEGDSELYDSGSSNAEKELEQDSTLQMAIGTAAHEFAHILGVTSSDLLFFYDSQTGMPRTPRPIQQLIQCVGAGSEEESTTEIRWMPEVNVLKSGRTSRGVLYYEITTPTVKQVVQNHFRCKSMSGARLENQPTNGDCIGSHFEERLFITENMSPVLGGVPEIFSSLTLALLHDSGWYEPDYRVAKISPFGHGVGCDFVEKDCVINGKLPAHSEDSFCIEEFKMGQKPFEGGFGCDPTFTHIGICDLVDYRTMNQLNLPGEKFSYFPENKNLGALLYKTADYCPTFSIDPVACRDVISFSNKLPKLGENMQKIESDSRDSKCFPTSSKRPICLDAKCDRENRIVKVTIGDIEFTCSDEVGQQQIQIPGSEVTIKCPKIAIICPETSCPSNCSGHGICDWDAKNISICKCFDAKDPTDGCYKSFESLPPKQPYADVRIGKNASKSHDSKLSWLGFLSLLYVTLLLNS